MSYNEVSVAANILNPATLCFCLGAVARLIKSELTIPKDVHSVISLFLLLGIGLKGGHELAGASLSALALPALVTVLLGVLTPLVAFGVMRRLGRLSVVDSAAVAAHYGSVSVVTFIAAQTFLSELIATRADLAPLEGYLPTLVALLESPGIAVALLLGVLLDKRSAGRSTASLLHEVLSGPTLFILLGGMLVGCIMGPRNWESVSGFFDPRGGVFRGLLCLFLLQMGIAAASRLSEVRRLGLFMVVIGVVLPLLNGALGVVGGYLAGLSVGGTAVLATMAASASYIAAPPAVRATLPEANPAIYLTLALGITFPFNVLVGIPVYFSMAEWVFKVLG